MNAELVENIEAEKYRFSPAGIAHLQHSQRVVHIKPLFRRRNVDPLDRTEWEHMSFLRENGWCCAVVPLREAIPPISLHKKKRFDRGK